MPAYDPNEAMFRRDHPEADEEYVLYVGHPHCETPTEREERFRKQAKQLLVATLTAIQNMGYYVAPTNTNSDVDVKSMEGWFTLNKIK